MHLIYIILRFLSIQNELYAFFNALIGKLFDICKFYDIYFYPL